MTGAEQVTEEPFSYRFICKEDFPQGLKPDRFWGIFGTTEVVP